MKARLAVVGVVILFGTTVSATDWPQWQGPDRTGLSKESGLLKEWPAQGPPVVWTATGLGAGYGSSPLRGAFGVQNRSAILSNRLGSSTHPVLKKTKRAPQGGPLCFLAALRVLSEPVSA